MSDRVLIGNRNGTDYGLYVSKPTYNVQTTGAENLLFNTDSLEGPLCLQTGQVNTAVSNSVSWSAGTLNYVPFVLLWNDSDNQLQPVMTFHVLVTGTRASQFRTYYQQALTHTQADTTGFTVIDGAVNTVYNYIAYAMGNTVYASVGP